MTGKSLHLVAGPKHKATTSGADVAQYEGVLLAVGCGITLISISCRAQGGSDPEVLVEIAMATEKVEAEAEFAAAARKVDHARGDVRRSGSPIPRSRG